VKRQEKRVILSALGVWPDRHGEMVHWQLAQGEHEPAWKPFLGQLSAQGMTEETPQLVVSDGAQGLEQALADHCSGVPHQRCVFHTIKKSADHLIDGDLEVDAQESDDKAKRKAQSVRKKAL
jgi:transposase-like protein